jgi:hypothetical protein
MPTRSAKTSLDDKLPFCPPYLGCHTSQPYVALSQDELIQLADIISFERSAPRMFEKWLSGVTGPYIQTTLDSPPLDSRKDRLSTSKSFIERIFLYDFVGG